jgi:hypothetical protein
MRRIVATAAFTICAVVPGLVYETAATAAPSNRPAASATKAGALQLKPAALPGATGAVAYRKWLSASGGTGRPYTFSLNTGSKRLPPGLTLQPNGKLSGIPTQAGTFPFTVRVTDTAGNTQTAAYSMTVSPGISLQVSGYVGKQCSVEGPFQSGSMTVKPFAFGPIRSVKGTVQVPGTNGPSLVTLSLNQLGSRGPLGVGWLTLINTTDAQCSAINPVFSLGRPKRLGLAAASGTGWFIATIDGVNYTLSVHFTVVTRF